MNVRVLERECKDVKSARADAGHECACGDHGRTRITCDAEEAIARARGTWAGA